MDFLIELGAGTLLAWLLYFYPLRFLSRSEDRSYRPYLGPVVGMGGEYDEEGYGRRGRPKVRVHGHGTGSKSEYTELFGDTEGAGE